MREVRVIDDEGKQLGVMPPYEALKIARERNLDLVEVSPTAQPPVCRIMDFGKYLYDQEKKERVAKKHQKVITVKEVKFRINVDEHDYETKKKHVLRFLDEGDKVKATIFFRGREMTRQSLGRVILERLIKELGDKAIVEFRPRQEGNTMHVILAPPKRCPWPSANRRRRKADSRARLRPADRALRPPVDKAHRQHPPQARRTRSHQLSALSHRLPKALLATGSWLAAHRVWAKLMRCRRWHMCARWLES